jgi:xylulose-5-phosphate/fructose-6-phosphate phosphoketolase
MFYLQDNPLLREPLKVEHIKHRLLGLGVPPRA